ncbi:transposase [Brasilonema octagenarum UFV-E1]|uniref:Transposase n=2 Tax=Brasilonema TaxID=383614 RepID=A0A856ME21_9CYAN|nr:MULTISPECIES: RNA-guided endonuclease TnpB family protein [Brasilonema]QDL13233.1 transposase [Brasilonema octagenarum UFV-E1]NMF62651.1 transposase [Brasilonema octagenarum UFV-OR1]QDL06869.1 transposase [Brasilonema sennae CENA114]QDL07950.1 transposase [Brasilonema sennae CENA114]QDL08912.1 transposase [Brasilonema sennae CENA114]
MYAIKVELKLNNKEQTLMRKHSGYARFVYNYGLALTQGLHSAGVKGSITKQINEIKKVFTNYTKKQPENQWMNELSSKVYQRAFMDLGQAYQRWAKGLSGKPVLKSKKNGDSFTVYDSNGKVLILFGKKIKIPTLGTFRLKEANPCSYCTQTFTISRQADKWYVSFAVDADRIPPTYHPQEAVGIDLGVKCFCTLSDGFQIEAPKPYKRAKTKLAKAQWRNRNKQSGNRRQGIKQSNRAKKFYNSIAKKHARIANQRQDFLHKTTTDISCKFYRIRIEDLNVSGMLANRKLSSAISDLGFYEFRRQLIYKSEFFGTKVELVDRWYPSSKLCSICGNKHDNLKLSDRVYQCQDRSCLAHTITMDRDLNAAYNLLNAPLDFVRLAQPEVTLVDKK